MASSFGIFRKHQKVFMAIAAVLCMIIFVFASALDGSGSSGGRGATNQVVATWDEGSIDENRLQNLVEQRNITNEFLRRVYFTTTEVEEQQSPPQPIFLMNVEGMPAIQMQGQAIDLEVMSEVAQKAGLSVTPGMVTQYIQHWSRGRADSDRIKEIFESLGRGRGRTTEKVVYSTLQKLLLSYHFRKSYEDPSLVMLPVDRWDNWRRVNEQVSVQAAVLPIEDFLADVPEPTDRQLKDYFEQYKDRNSNVRDSVQGRIMPAREPGFASAPRVRLHTLKASPVDWRKKFLDEVSDKDVEKFYEDNKDLQFVKPAGSDDEEEETSEDSSEDEASEEDVAMPNVDEADSDGEDKPESVSEESEAEESEEIEEESDAEETTTVSEETTSGETVTDESEAEETVTETIETATDESVSEEEEEEEEVVEETTVESGSDTSETEEVSDDVETTEGDTEQGDGRYGPTEYVALDNKLRNEIREYLAGVKAAEAVQTAMENAEQELSNQFISYGIARVTAEEKGEDPPEVPSLLKNMKPLGEKYDLEFEKLAMMTQAELAENTLVGPSREVSGEQRPVALFAFNGSDLYEPIMTSEQTSQPMYSNFYLVVRVEEELREEPVFADVREEVLDAWKRNEAMKLAEAKADELAAAYEKSEETFFEFFDSKKIAVETTDPFAWLTFQPNTAGRRPPVISEVPGIENAGEEFMETVFSLKDEKAAATMNHDHSAAYVVKIHGRERTQDQLRSMYLIEANSWLGQNSMLQADRQKFTSSVQERIKERIGFEFNEEWMEQANERE
ncbi:hypothetical protein [Adhaeretor mobilis]|uniref:PpiC domain-containing protein n=1 Tax=Adhaeretor mobilis TaxID=1930276 RepID=A0A517MUI9_9BACT|nr:hypothetical protein [Adhaeretor mobilis]QDS98540.1 hypothetical protein HG15A2_18210 [Adhaeretor mobilis]